MSTVASAAAAPSRALHFGLWAVQGLLAFAFLGAGVMKTTTPHAELAAMMPWAADAPTWLPRFIGASELAGAAGLVLPAALRVLPVLTPVAAGALAFVMVLAAATHLAYGEIGAVVPNAVLFSLALFVAWGRSVKAPIQARVTA